MPTDFTPRTTINAHDLRYPGSLPEAMGDVTIFGSVVVDFLNSSQRIFLHPGGSITVMGPVENGVIAHAISRFEFPINSVVPSTITATSDDIVTEPVVPVVDAVGQSTHNDGLPEV